QTTRSPARRREPSARHRRRASCAEALEEAAPSTSTTLVEEFNGSAEEGEETRQVGPLSVVGDGPLVVREKTHSAAPMTLDQALYEMELVGHDFFLFVDKESERPSVVYRRRGYDYGVISLELT